MICKIYNKNKKGLFINLAKYFQKDINKLFNIIPISFVVCLNRINGEADVQNFLDYYLKNKPIKYE
jgi:hypothetical protein